MGGKTDHGGYNLGDIAVVIIGGVLLLYTGYRSFSVLNSTLAGRAGFGELAAIAGLWGLDIGMIGWAIVWMYGSTTREQNWLSLAMVTICFLGFTVTTIFDMVRDSAGVNQATSVTVIVLVGFVILLNVAAAMAYHLTSPQTRLARRAREMKASLAKQNQDAKFEITQRSLQADAAEEILNQRQALIEREKRLAHQKIELDRIDRETREKLARAAAGSPASTSSSSPVPSTSSTPALEQMRAERLARADAVARMAQGGNGDEPRALHVDAASPNAQRQPQE